jgi:nucleotide-binding universal stress UspA family protein
MGTGPVIIGFDGSPTAERAVHESGALLAPRPALVVVVWEAGKAFELATLPIGALETPATLDVRTAIEVDRARYESAQRTAERGAALAREAGFDAEGLAVADDITVADTLLRLAQDNDAAALVVGAHRHGALAEILLGSTSREVVRRALVPVVVVRDRTDQR